LIFSFCFFGFSFLFVFALPYPELFLRFSFVSNLFGEDGKKEKGLLHYVYSPRGAFAPDAWRSR